MAPGEMKVFFKNQSFLIYFIFILLLIFVPTKAKAWDDKNSCIINNNNLIICKNEYNTLKNLEFTELEIRNMDKEEFDKNKNLKGTIVVQSDIKDENIISSSVKLLLLQKKS